MICPYDYHPCSGDHSQACWAACGGKRRKAISEYVSSSRSVEELPAPVNHPSVAPPKPGLAADLERVRVALYRLSAMGSLLKLTQENLLRRAGLTKKQTQWVLDNPANESL
jgi:hypothetical protein